MLFDGMKRYDLPISREYVRHWGADRGIGRVDAEMNQEPAAVAIDHIDIPAAALSHRFMREAMACATIVAGQDVENVIGTANTGHCELYGWGADVCKHVDRTGFVYLCVLDGDGGTLHTQDGSCVRLLPGTVIRLDDRVVHWTEGGGVTVAAFVGSFPSPCDVPAISVLREGVRALERGKYQGAPRVRHGFRYLLDDECYTGNESPQAMLIDEAVAAGALIIPCALCERPAVEIDKYWPYHGERNRCRAHDGSAKPGSDVAGGGAVIPCQAVQIAMSDHPGQIQQVQSL